MRRGTLKPKQLGAIKLLAAGVPAYQVAERLEVSTMTIYRWRQLVHFDEKLHTVAYSGLEEIAKKMNAATITAVETLQEAMCDMREPVTTRMKAALGVLSTTASVNGMLEKSLQHRVGDFDLRKRINFSEPLFSYDSCGNRIIIKRRRRNAKTPDVIDV